eukprot:1493353-Prymnesium_polylepis.1
MVCARGCAGGCTGARRGAAHDRGRARSGRSCGALRVATMCARPQHVGPRCVPPPPPASPRLPASLPS